MGNDYDNIKRLYIQLYVYMTIYIYIYTMYGQGESRYSACQSKGSQAWALVRVNSLPLRRQERTIRRSDALCGDPLRSGT
jgi:hypothetical protein